MRIEWSSSAVTDLQAITEWIDEDRGTETANRIARRIYEGSRACGLCPTGADMGEL